MNCSQRFVADRSKWWKEGHRKYNSRRRNKLKQFPSQNSSRLPYKKWRVLSSCRYAGSFPFHWSEAPIKLVYSKKNKTTRDIHEKFTNHAYLGDPKSQAVGSSECSRTIAESEMMMQGQEGNYLREKDPFPSITSHFRLRQTGCCRKLVAQYVNGENHMSEERHFSRRKESEKYEEVEEIESFFRS